MFFLKKKIYCDYAAATPVRREVLKEMSKFWREYFHNPSSIYDEGRKARNYLENYRARVARMVGAGTRDVIFTSGGTEANNLAILGAFEEAKEHFKKPHLIISRLEHPSVSEIAEEIRRRGGEVSIVPAREIPKHFKKSTFLVSVTLASSSTGEIQPVAKIGRAVRARRAETGLEYPILHTDVSQAASYLEINAEKLHADLMTLDGAKVYGPRGVGALIVRPRARIRPTTLGGGQERGLRPGTENVASIAGFTKALELAVAEREGEGKRLLELRQTFLAELGLLAPERDTETLPNIVTIALPGKLAEFVALSLEREGVLVSAGSACTSIANEEPEQVRFSFGRNTTKSDVLKVAKALQKVSQM